jgi:hypothetical protein
VNGRAKARKDGRKGRTDATKKVRQEKQEGRKTNCVLLNGGVGGAIGDGIVGVVAMLMMCG